MSRIFERPARTGLVLSLLLTLVATTAISQEETAEKKKTKNPFKETACESDAANVCGLGRSWRHTYDCLRENYADVAPECAAYTDEILAKKRARVAARHEVWKKACAEEIEANCSQYTKLHSMKGCLDRIRDQVSDECDAALPQRGRHKGPGSASWRDGSEPENFIEEREKARKERYEARRRQIEAKAKRDAEAGAAEREPDQKATAAGDTAADTATDANGSE